MLLPMACEVLYRLSELVYRLVVVVSVVFLQVDLQVLDQLKQALMAAGTLEVEIQSASANADKKVQSRLRIRGKV